MKKQIIIISILCYLCSLAHSQKANQQQIYSYEVLVAKDKAEDARQEIKDAGDYFNKVSNENLNYISNEQLQYLDKMTQKNLIEAEGVKKFGQGIDALNIFFGKISDAVNFIKVKLNLVQQITDQQIESKLTLFRKVLSNIFDIILIIILTVLLVKIIKDEDAQGYSELDGSHPIEMNTQQHLQSENE